MDITQWLQDKISKGEIHRDYLTIYNWIQDNYKKYQESENGKAKEELDSGGNQETGSTKSTVKRTGRKTNTGEKINRRRKKTRETRSEGEIG